MAVVSGHSSSFFPSAVAELDTNNSDDEYDYVSSLAEQIAHAMLDEDEPPSDDHSDLLFHHQALLSERRAAFLRLQREAELAKDALNARLSRIALPAQPFLPEEIALLKSRHVRHPVAVASVPAEAWDCFPGDALLRSRPSSSHAGSLHEHNPNSLYKRPHVHWNAASSSNEEREPWMRANVEACRHSNAVTTASQRSISRKESVGTGVFLPRVASFGSQSRRKTDNSMKMGDKNKHRSGR